MRRRAPLARLTTPLGEAARSRGLQRLRRSAAKLDPAGRLLPAAALDRFEAAYWHPERETERDAVGCVREHDAVGRV